MSGFSYHSPETTKAAAQLLSEKSDGCILAGGHSLLPAIKLGLNAPSDLIDIRKLGLSGITEDGGDILIGATTLHRDVAENARVKDRIPALAVLAGSIGDPMVRNAGTIGGSIANNDPAADYPAAVLALDATIITDRRQIRADDFFLGLFETALEEDEIILSVHFPVPVRAVYRKIKQPASRFALTGVFVAETSGKARVAVTGAGQNGVFRFSQLEAELDRRWHPSVVEGCSLGDMSLIADIHADAEYRANLVNVLAKRAIQGVQRDSSPT